MVGRVGWCPFPALFYLQDKGFVYVVNQTVFEGAETDPRPHFPPASGRVRRLIALSPNLGPPGAGISRLFHGDGPVAQFQVGKLKLLLFSKTHGFIPT